MWGEESDDGEDRALEWRLPEPQVPEASSHRPFLNSCSRNAYLVHGSLAPPVTQYCDSLMVFSARMLHLLLSLYISLAQCLACGSYSNV